jgi:hypothetical protein
MGAGDGQSETLKFKRRAQLAARNAPGLAPHIGQHNSPVPRDATMLKHKVFALKFAKVYPMYVAKAEAKKRTRKELDQIICWLTGYDAVGLRRQIEGENDLETFFAQAPRMNPNTTLIKGVVCGIRVEEIDDPLMQKIRFLDKLVDELAKGKAMDKILRQ